MSRYANDPVWADVIPVPHDDGGPNPLAAITYTEEYAEAMSYLRAIMADNEISERARALTADIISMNPAHYTIWYVAADRDLISLIAVPRPRIYRATILKSLPSSDLGTEISWLNDIALKNLKNYQIWHHRQGLIDSLADPSGEREFINSMLAEDAKNYHVWSYRQWLVARFGLWEDACGAGEWGDVDRMLDEDVRNNSVWNHRFFLLSRGGARDSVPSDRVEGEIEYVGARIALAPQNQSPWSYIRGVVTGAGLPLSRLKTVCEPYADLGSGDDGEKVKSRHALHLLAEIWTMERDKARAARAYDLLATKYDPIRARYWDFCKAAALASDARDATV